MVLGGLEVALADEDGRGDELVGGEHRGGDGGGIGDGEGDVGLAGGFDARGGGAPAEAERERDFYGTAHLNNLSSGHER
jgi:hypothetical protein